MIKLNFIYSFSPIYLAIFLRTLFWPQRYFTAAQNACFQLKTLPLNKLP